MSKGDKVIFFFVVMLAGGFTISTLTSHRQHKPSGFEADRGVVLNASAMDVIGLKTDFVGNAKNPYTLIEFGDYQCPPCHQAAQELPELLRNYPKKIRFEFRNLPLTTIHSSAMLAALDAETSRKLDKFWQVHDALYQIDPNGFTDDAVERVIADQDFNSEKFNFIRATWARKSVETDVREAEKLGLNSTPSFVLCEPDGRVIRLKNLNQIKNYL